MRFGLVPFVPLALLGDSCECVESDGEDSKFTRQFDILADLKDISALAPLSWQVGRAESRLRLDQRPRLCLRTPREYQHICDLQSLNALERVVFLIVVELLWR